MEQIAFRVKPSPCKGCADRVPGCHGKCEKYIKFRADLDKSKAEKDRAIMLSDAKWNSLCRTTKTKFPK